MSYCFDTGLDWDEIAMEAHLFPWLDSDCMGDLTAEQEFFDDEEGEEE